jgi:hypothetical protein
MLTVSAIIRVALIFDFVNGFHDAANSIATVVSTRVLSPRWAVLWAAFFNFVAFLLFGVHVANTIGKGIVNPASIDPAVVAAALAGAIAWDLITWWYGIPSSSSHALIGGLAGAGVAKAGTSVLDAAGLAKVAVSILLSPLVGLALAFVLMTAVFWLFRRSTPARVDAWFRRGQLVSAALYSLGHEGNDAQKTIGHHHRPPVHDRPPRGHVLRAAVGGPHLPCRDRARDALGWLAHRSDDGAPDHEAEAGRGLLRRDRRGHHALRGDRARYPRLDDAHDHGRHHRRRRGDQALCDPMGGRAPDRRGLGADDPVLGLHLCGRLVGAPRARRPVNRTLP